MAEKRTLTGKKIYSEREPGKPKFGHTPKKKQRPEKKVLAEHQAKVEYGTVSCFGPSNDMVE